MTLEEKSYLLMQSYQTISYFNQELKDTNQEYRNQNEYLKRQVGEAMQQKKKVLAGSTGTVRGDADEEASNPLGSLSKGKFQRSA